MFTTRMAVCCALVLGARDVTAQSAARPPVLRATIDLNIGEANETRDAYIFGAIDGLAMDAQGRIVVADSKDHTVRVFSASGRHLYTFGQLGKGPGDLDMPCCLTMSNTGEIWIKENGGNHRYSVFRLGATKATFVRTIRGTTSPVGSADRVDFDSKGRLIDLGTIVDATRTFRKVRLFLDSAGTVLARDTIHKAPKDSLSDVSVPTRNGVSVYLQPHGARELSAFGANGEVALAVSSNYAVAWFGAEGKRKALLQRAGLTAPVLSAKERESADALLNAIARNTGVPRAELPLTIPNRKAPLTSLGFDLDGRLWVERTVVDGQPGEADVYDRSGRLVAIMQWPPGVRMRGWAVRGTTGLAVGVDDDGVQRVVRLQFK